MKHDLLAVWAKASRNCMLNDGHEISIEYIHKLNKKSTPKQSMLYHISLKLHKPLNDHEFDLSFQIVMKQIVFTRRQTNSQISRNNTMKISMNTAANVNNQIGLNI